MGAEPGYYNENQTEQLNMAILHGLSISQLMIMSELDELNQSEEYPAGVPLFDEYQMEEIRLGFESGLPIEKVLLYADPSLTQSEMRRIRLENTPEEDVIADALEGIREDDFEVTTDQVERHVQQTGDRRNYRTLEVDRPFQMEQAGIRLVKERAFYSTTPIDSPGAAVEILGEELRQYDRELVAVINCTSALHPINVSICSIGTINRALISPRELLKTAILSNASGVVLLHTHPSGDATPSRLDIRITERLKEAYSLMDIQLLDHVVVGDREFFSFQEHGMMGAGTAHTGSEFRYKVDIRQGWWTSCKVMLEDEFGELHDTGQERFFASAESAEQYKKMLEGGADEAIAYANSMGFENSSQHKEGLIL